MVSATRVQNLFGSLMKASASASFCLARTCGGTTGIGGRSPLCFRHHSQALAAKAIRSAAARADHNQTHSLEMATGALMGRMSLVVAAADWAVEARLVFIGRLG